MVSAAMPAEDEYRLLGADDATKDDEEFEEEQNEELGDAGISEPLFAAAEKKLVRKLDRRLMPCLFAMIVLNYLDRNALANARVQGIEKSLGLTGSEFNTAISVFFIGYIGLQVPSNLLLTRVRPSLYLPGCMLAWGLLSGTTAFVTSFQALATARFFLGMAEAPFFPGALFLLSSWYTRRELALRTAILYSGSLLSGALGALAAAAVQRGLAGAAQLPPWRWLFGLEACATLALAAAAAFALPDFPASTRWLSGAERALAAARLRRTSAIDDGGPRARPRLAAGLRAAAADQKVWLLAGIVAAKTVGGGAAAFAPTLVATLGPQTPAATLVLVAPPYVVAAVVALAVSRSSDARGERAAHVVVSVLVAAGAFAAAAAAQRPALRYAALFGMLAGVYAAYNVALAWIASTVPSPAEKRSTAVAIVNTVGNLVQVFTPYMYLASFGPRYLLAMVVTSGACVTCAVLTLVLRRLMVRDNARLAISERLGEDGEGDGKTPGFRYVL